MTGHPRAADAAVDWVHWGRVGYADAMRRQEDRFEGVCAGTASEALFTLEHEPVITLGRRGREQDLLAPIEGLRSRGIEVVRTDRGGEVTYHGPGQLVLYAVLDIGRRGVGVSDLVRGLAAGAADALGVLGVVTRYDPEHPGLWVRDAKIGAVGMRVRRGVSLHGIAVNLTTPLDAFRLFVPCGMPGAAATSVRDCGIEPPPLADLARATVQAAALRLQLTLSDAAAG